MRPLLEFLDTYYLDPYVDSTYKKRRVWLSSEPSPVCWFDFRTHVGRHIRCLSLNTSSLVASKYCLELLNSTAPRIGLPGLAELRVIVDQAATELELATKFMQHSIKCLHLEVWEPLPNAHRARYAMQRQAELDIRMFKVDEATPPAYPLAAFLSDIARYMPDITTLSFNMRDFDEMRRAWPDFLHLCTSLLQLESLKLPSRALTTTVVSALVHHPTLRYLSARDFPKKRKVAPSEPYDDLLVVDDSIASIKPETLAKWSGLTITVSPMELLSCLRTSGSLHLTSLHVNLSAVIVDTYGANALIAAIVEVCPTLQDLKISPIVSPDPHNIVIRPNYEMLAPLRKLCDLTSLEVIATHASQFTSDQFVYLVSSWGKLTRLVLDHPEVTVPDPLEKASLSLPAVLWARKQYCPRLKNITLYISPDVKSSLIDVVSYPARSEQDITSPILEVSLCIGYAAVGDATRMAYLLAQELPATCTVELYPTIHTVHSVLDSPEHLGYWITRNQVLRQFVKKVHSTRAALIN
ncbi:hypothetical protein EIP86_001695 [Pleurotus ostreatoroseus]|nr:hypothetical protein EIP86_001695 [Pleurotus ostreatoroseus]